MKPIRDLHNDLASGQTTSRALVEEALERALDPAGEGARVFTRLDADRARKAADAADAMRKAGLAASPLCGLPITVKALFDIEGEPTTAASPQRETAPPAERDAVAVACLRQAGAVILGSTNMTEFAFSGVGLNPHYGTPANPYKRERPRIPGGSSSGAAISVTDGIAAAALGSDTGGSVRIPAALCGLTGFKSTKRRIPMDGAFPLARTLDSAGPIAPSVLCCYVMDAVMAGEPVLDLEPAMMRRVCFGLPRNYFLEELDPEVARAFEAALSRLSALGAKLTDIKMPEFDEIAAVNACGGLSAPEAFALHRRLGTDLERCDPLVGARIRRGDIRAADYVDMLEARASIVRRFDERYGEIEAILCPTVPIIAPEIAALENNEEEYRRVNSLLLRNTNVVNFLDRCAISIPCQAEGEAPIGLQLIGRPMDDCALAGIALAVERALKR